MSNKSTNLAAVLPSAGSNLAIEERAIPSPGPDEVLVRNHAIAVNPIDWKRQVMGLYISSYPTILGLDVSGIVEAVGSAVTLFKKGDRVLGLAPVTATGNPDHAAFQTYTLVQASAIAKLPDTLTFKQAATLPGAISTASVTLFDVLGLPLPQQQSTPTLSTTASPSTGILVWSGASSAGNATIQLARLAGLKVFASASPRHHALVRSLGATEVVDYRSPTAVADLVSAAQRAGVAIRYAVDCISTEETTPLVLDVLTKFGGAKKLAHLWTWPEQIAVPDGVEETFVNTVVIWTERRDLAARVFNELLPVWLKKGEVVPQTARVIDGGLEGLQTALEELRKGSRFSRADQESVNTLLQAYTVNAIKEEGNKKPFVARARGRSAIEYREPGPNLLERKKVDFARDPSDPVYALLLGLNAATLSQKAITDRLTRIVVFLSSAAGMLYNALWYFPVLMVAAGPSFGKEACQRHQGPSTFIESSAIA
ncbi:uncharacterized protein B0T15DRAFT_508306 [Chaetomium strumarium]|uniref:Enoyl reductase (ER) domain-containing protein n=1 Tax=Chaetomium strumarium TaxID=1170767 RepID=A0AAJ0M3M0_9PEZI|nr:hypothetical protein B0T15DRAFT_508306 [Chaetomium strumarium]